MRKFDFEEGAVIGDEERGTCIHNARGLAVGSWQRMCSTNTNFSK